MSRVLCYDIYMQPMRFIDEPVEIVFDEPPALEKKPECPDGFIWQGETFRVSQVLAEWFDFERRGRNAKNMRPEHASRASIHGSWGVGRFFFRVQVETGRVFELYYDRAPKDADHRKGAWFLYLERL
jgi:hypothetical protein